MSYLKLELIKKDYFDPLAKINIPEYKLEVWPGYLTSIRQHERAIMLCAQISHKILRNENVLSLLNECARSGHGDFKQLFKDKIISSVVLTDYNNRTYRIDDIDWNSTPNSKFEKSDGTSISYVEYYQTRYNLRITQPQQPMLVSRAKKREIRAGLNEIVMLVPELCRLTSLTDQQRADFHLMRALAEHTRIGPTQRIDKLLQFSRRLNNEPKVVEELRKWDMQLAERLVEFTGRVLPQETIIGGEGRSYPSGHDVDWTKSLRSNPMVVLSQVQNWVLMTPNRCRNSANSFAQLLGKAASGMKWRLPPPKVFEINDDRPPTYLQGIQQVRAL